jgi:hypothetical protein
VMKPAAHLAFTMVALFVVANVLSAGAADKRGSAKKEVLRGHVIADVASLGFGTGLGPLWTSFIFDAEQADGRMLPVRIAYAFYKNEQLPRDSFWDYQILYELKAKRDASCDTTVARISYEQNFDDEGKNLPLSFVLRFAKNASSTSLSPDIPLPCYVLRYSDYKQLVSASVR